MTDEARRLLHTHFDVVLGRLLLHYEKSQHRRDEGLQTAFKVTFRHYFRTVYDNFVNLFHKFSL